MIDDQIEPVPFGTELKGYVGHTTLVDEKLIPLNEYLGRMKGRLVRSSGQEPGNCRSLQRLTRRRYPGRPSAGSMPYKRLGLMRSTWSWGWPETSKDIPAESQAKSGLSLARRDWKQCTLGPRCLS